MLTKWDGERWRGVHIAKLGMGGPHPRKLGKAPHPTRTGRGPRDGGWGGMGGRDRSAEGDWVYLRQGYMDTSRMLRAMTPHFVPSWEDSHLGEPILHPVLVFVFVFRNQQRALMVMTSNAH